MNGIHEVTGSIPVWSTTFNPPNTGSYADIRSKTHFYQKVTQDLGVHFGAFLGR